MEFKFVPSLMQIVSAKIALRLMKDDDISYWLDRDIMIPYQFEFFDRGRHRIWKLIETAIIEKLSEVPRSVSIKVVEVIQPMHFQAMVWLRDHDMMPPRKGFSVDYKTLFCWGIDGSIDRIRTAKKYVQINTVDSKDRFAMACNYFFKEDIVDLWDVVKIVGMNTTARRGVNSAIRLWMDLLRRGCTNPTSEMIEEYFRIEHLTETDIPLRLNPYFPYLSPALRRDYFPILTSNQLHQDDFRLCLGYMDEGERTEYFHALAGEGLTRYLEFPFQSLFIDMVDEISCYMVIKDYIYVLNYLLKLFMLSGDIYSVLIKEYWSNIPFLFKDGIKEGIKNFEAFDVIINYKQNRSRALEELVAKHYFSH